MDVEPFPHLWLDEGLPPDLYAAAAHAWPPIKRPQPSVQAHAKIDFTPAGAVWEAVHQHCQNVLTPRLVAIFEPWVAAHIQELQAHSTRWGHARVDTLTANRGRMMIRYQGYQLHPHIDLAPFGITVLHYFPSDDQPDDASGTRIYHAAEPLPVSALDQAKTQYFEDYGIATHLVKTVPWRANGCLAFPNTRASAHGLFLEGPHPRRVFQWHVAVPAQASPAMS